MLNLAILDCAGRPDVLGIYVKGALATGVSVDEIEEVLIQRHRVLPARQPGVRPSRQRMRLSWRRALCLALTEQLHWM